GLGRYESATDERKRAGDWSALVLPQQWVRPASPPPGPPIASVILKDVRALNVRYFGDEDKDSAPQWQDAWRHPRRLPRLVSVDVTFVRPEGRKWVPLIVALPFAD